MCTEGFNELSNASTNATKADDADGFFLQKAPHKGRPRASADIAISCGNTPQCIQHVGESQFSNGIGSGIWCVYYRDIQFTSCSEVNAVESGSDSSNYS
jgi:hypothetical protein